MKSTFHKHWVTLLLTIVVTCIPTLPPTLGNGLSNRVPVVTFLADTFGRSYQLPVTTFDGKPMDIASAHGWRVLYFWSSSCPCVRACETTSLVPLAREYAGKVTFYAVLSDGFDLGKTPAELHSDVTSHHLPYSVVLDRSHAVAKELGAEVTTQTYVIDPSNRIVFSGAPDDSRQLLKSTGRTKATKTYLATALKEALAGKALSNPHPKGVGCIISW